MAVAFVTGITGQDGSYLTERLTAEGVEVHGLVHTEQRRASWATPLPASAVLHEGDLADGEALESLIRDIAPDEVYNLAGISSVARSWQEPALTGALSGLAVTHLLGAALAVQETTGRRVGVVQASSAEIFGRPDRVPQDELTAVRPTNPYGAAKAYGHHMASVYRSRGLAVASCILFNHESPRRPPNFVTRKITQAAARIARDGTGQLELGNLDARRDWGWAPDFVDAMVLAARHGDGGDYVVATGTAHSVAEFCSTAFSRVGVDDWQSRVHTNPSFLRPTDTATMVGDAGKAHDVLGWRPTATFTDIVHAMVDHDVSLLAHGS